MRKCRAMFLTLAAIVLLSTSAGVASAVNLLLNGNLDNLPLNQGGAVINNWNLDMSKTNSGPTTDLITLEDFPAIGPNTTALPVRDLSGFVKGFQGNNTTGDRATLRMSQDVAALPGQQFVLSAYVGAGVSYSGLQAGPTQTLLELIFDNDNDRTNGDLGRFTRDLKAAGLTGGAFPGFANQLFTTPVGTAPAGALFVRAQFAGIDMYSVAGADPSAFIDDFDLEAVPEPGTVVLGLLGIIGLWGAARRR